MLLTVLQRLEKNTDILNTIKIGKLEYFGHLMRNNKYQLMQNIMQGKIEGSCTAA